MTAYTKAGSVYQILNQMITTGPLANEPKLPPIRALAKELKTSPVTLMKAIELLEKEKILFRKSRSGIYNAKAKVDVTKHQIIPTKKKKYEYVAEQIETDIQQGKFKIGSYLPSNKYLSFQYHVSNDILRLALLKANSKGLIHRHAGYWIVGEKLEPSLFSLTRKYAYIIGELPPSHRMLDNTFYSTFLRSLETELQNQGIIIKDYLQPEEYNSWVYLVQESSTAGFVIVGGFWAGKVLDPDKTLEKILFLFRKEAPPLVINDFNNSLVRPEIFPLKANIFPLWYNNQKGPEITAAHLAQKGHKKVAFLTYNEKNMVRFSDMNRKLKQISGEDAEVFFHSIKFKTDMAPLTIKQIPSSARLILPAIFWNHKFKKVDPLERLYLRMGRTVMDDLCWQAIYPLLEDLIKIKEISAWVCDETIVALAVVDFLEEKGIRIPERLSIFSLYGDERCLDKRITSFERGHDIAGYLAAHCILGDIPIRKTRNGLVEIEGKLMVRNTVGLAREEGKG